MRLQAAFKISWKSRMQAKKAKRAKRLVKAEKRLKHRNTLKKYCAEAELSEKHLQELKA